MKRARFTEEQIIGVLERDLVRLKHTGVFEVVCAFSRREAVEQRADGSPGLVDCSGVGFAQQGFHFGEGLLDWIEVWRVGGQEEELGLGGADRGANGPAVVAAEVVHDDNVARREDGHENLFDISVEARAVAVSEQTLGLSRLC
jgi:hypothetical protein